MLAAPGDMPAGIQDFRGLPLATVVVPARDERATLTKESPLGLLAMPLLATWVM